jgi:hypothetical protein
MDALSPSPSSRRKPGSIEQVQSGQRCSMGKNLGDPGFRRDDGKRVGWDFTWNGLP